MGNVAAALGKHALRKTQRFNIESRTNRFLEKNVKVAAPKPLATQREIEKLNQEMPNLMEELQKPNPELIDRLKDVYVSSLDPPPEKFSKPVDPKKPLPVQRTTEPEDHFYVEPTTLPPGKLSLKQALQLLSKYQLDKKTNTVESLAQDYNLSIKDVENIVEYFKVYTLVDLNPKTVGFDATINLTDSTDDIKFTLMTAPTYLESITKTKENSENVDKLKKIEDEAQAKINTPKDSSNQK